MRNTPEAARYHQIVFNKMQQCAGVSVGSTCGVRGAAGVKESLERLNGGMSGLGVRDAPLTAPSDSHPAAHAPAQPARGAPAVLGIAAAADMSTLAALAVTGAAKRPEHRASVADRTAQASNEQAAKAVLVCKLRNTRELYDSSEGSSTDSAETV